MTDRDQASAFERKARELGCDESETAFDAKLGKLVKVKPKPLPKKKRHRKRTAK